jgi:hypothetical protein
MMASARTLVYLLLSLALVPMAGSVVGRDLEELLPPPMRHSQKRSLLSDNERQQAYNNGRGGFGGAAFSRDGKILMTGFAWWDVRRGRTLGQRLERTIIKAGVTAWPKLFQNLRSSRQTELSAVYPITDVCAWMGNTPNVAADHYLQQADRLAAAAAGRATRRTWPPTTTCSPWRTRSAGRPKTVRDPVQSWCRIRCRLRTTRNDHA